MLERSPNRAIFQPLMGNYTVGLVIYLFNTIVAMVIMFAPFMQARFHWEFPFTSKIPRIAEKNYFSFCHRKTSPTKWIQISFFEHVFVHPKKKKKLLMKMRCNGLYCKVIAVFLIKSHIISSGPELFQTLPSRALHESLNVLLCCVNVSFNSIATQLTKMVYMLVNKQEKKT